MAIVEDSSEDDVSEYNYASFPLDMDGHDFASFSSVLSAGGAAPDGELTDAHSGERVALSSYWKSKALVIEFGSFS